VTGSRHAEPVVVHEKDAETRMKASVTDTATITVAFKKPQGGELTDAQQTYNKVHNGLITQRHTPLRGKAQCISTPATCDAAARSVGER